VNIPVIFEDDWLLVVNKPSGLLVIPTPKNEQRTLTSILNEDLKDKGVLYRFHPCHRLDRETSGLMIYAKGKSVQRKVMDLFRQRGIIKTYIAFVQGNPVKSNGEIRGLIEGSQAVTKYKVIANSKNFSILEVHPITGRTNQIRIHLKNIGHPIIGERKFAFRKDYSLKAKRICLHARSLDFRHPITGRLLRLTCELSDDLQKFLNKYSSQ
jgi:23S rRNA pseudouridine1911/1915/1917 synthase